MKTLALALFLACACGSPAPEAPDAGPPPPSAGLACASPGFGSCSPDAGDLLECTGGAWRAIDDCREREGCVEANGTLHCRQRFLPDGGF